MRKLIIFPFVLLSCSMVAQEVGQDTATVYKKRVLENTEMEFLGSYYSQTGNNAAVSGGIGSEELTDVTPTYVVKIPLNEDDVLSIDVGVSAYTSASSSNIDPFDGGSKASPFQASSGASSGDTWINLNASYSHSSDDRNTIWGATASVANEYDYISFGLSGNLTKLFNEKNTELSFKASAYIDQWTTLYPRELRAFDSGGNGLNDPLFTRNILTGSENYAPSFMAFNEKGRQSYAVGTVFSQVLSPKMQASLAADVVYQQGLLSTPFQRVYFSDVADSFIEDFHLADDVERLPDTRFKIALGGRLNWYLNELFVLRTFYRYYNDDWGINSHTASVEVPIKLSNKFTLYPSYRYYQQSAADYFAPYEQHLSTSEFYTSDYDLSKFSANQYSLGISYTDIFTKFRVRRLGLKSIDFKYSYYKRDSGLEASIFSLGFKFIRD